MDPHGVGNTPANGLAHRQHHNASSSCHVPAQWKITDIQNCRALTDQQDLNLRVYVTGDGPDVYEDSFMATATSPNGSFKPTVILISTRLGIDKITQVYWEALIAALHMPQSIGIAGYELS